MRGGGNFTGCGSTPVVSARQSLQVYSHHPSTPTPPTHTTLPFDTLPLHIIEYSFYLFIHPLALFVFLLSPLSPPPPLPPLYPQNQRACLREALVAISESIFNTSTTAATTASATSLLVLSLQDVVNTWQELATPPASTATEGPIIVGPKSICHSPQALLDACYHAATGKPSQITQSNNPVKCNQSNNPVKLLSQITQSNLTTPSQ